jgi:hypothetical protein
MYRFVKVLTKKPLQIMGKNSKQTKAAAKAKANKSKRPSVVDQLSSEDEDALFDTDEEPALPKTSKAKEKEKFPSPGMLRSKRHSSSCDDYVPPVPPAAEGSSAGDNPANIPPVKKAAPASKPPKRRFETVDESADTLNVDAEETMADTTDRRSVQSLPMELPRETPVSQNAITAPASTRSNLSTPASHVTPQNLAMPRSNQRHTPSILSICDNIMDPVMAHYKQRYTDVYLNSGQSAYIFKISQLCMASFSDIVEIRNTVKPIHTDFMAFRDWERSSEVHRREKTARYAYVLQYQ